jgi:glycosyltransferase involved in cell wall biosynthesis
MSKPKASLPKVLLIAPECPWPADIGLKTHLWHVIQAWTGAVELTVFGFYHTGEERRRWASFAARQGFRLGGLAPVQQGRAWRWGQARCLGTGRPLVEARYASRQARQEVQALVSSAEAAGSPFAWVAFEVFHTLMPLQFGAPTRQLLFPVDSYTLYYARMHQQASSLGEWLRTGYLRWVCERMERRRYGGMDRIVTVAAPDASALRRLLPDAPVEVVPVPAAAVAERVASGPKQRPRVLVAGYFGIPTIARDTELFLQAWRELPARPEAELIVWGRGSNRAQMEAACQAAGARLVEWVDNYEEFLASGDLYVYPQRFACGVQTKVQQAMRAGLAVMAVPEVLAPLGARHGSEGWQIQHPRQAAAELAALLPQGPRWERLGTGAAALMEREFSPERIHAQLRALVGAAPDGGSQPEGAVDDAMLHC